VWQAALIDSDITDRYMLTNAAAKAARARDRVYKPFDAGGLHLHVAATQSSGPCDLFKAAFGGEPLDPLRAFLESPRASFRTPILGRSGRSDRSVGAPLLRKILPKFLMATLPVTRTAITSNAPPSCGLDIWTEPSNANS
jgi:hypothetical protein